MCRRAWISILLPATLLAAPVGVRAQTMEEVLNGLFLFSSGGDPLFLAGSAGVAATAAHGDHFIPAEAESNGALLGVFTSAISGNIANFPLSSTVSSETFRFVGGVPTPTSNSFGPIFSERAQTLGRGRFDVGFSYSSIRFNELRGTAMDDLQLNFVHQNTDFPNCGTIFGGDCSLSGFPLWEHDVIELGLDLRIDAEIYAFNATFGVLDWLDVGIAVPVVALSIDGASRARIIPSQVDEPAHFFGGSQASPILEATTTTRGSTSGIGDVAARTKVRFLDGEVTDLAMLGEVRLPTGRVEDFLGSGEASVRGLFIGSATLGDFSPHVNFGYVHRRGDLQSSSVQLAAGFDQRLSDWSTFVIDLLGDFKTENSLSFPGPLTFDPPIVRTVERANIPNVRDDTLDAAIGMKVQTSGGVVLWGNALVSLNEGGMRSDIIATFGVQYSSR
jgi:hypothetical protein